MTDAMIDLETLGNSKNKCIVQIGACYFDRVTGDIGKEFKCNVDAGSHVFFGAEIDAKTVYWWLSQDKAAQESILKEPRINISIAMTDLNSFLSEAKCIWSHSTFDFVTVMETFHQLNIEPKFSYKTARDIRTAVDLGRVSIKDQVREGVHHDALADCKYQVKYLVEALKEISRKSVR